MALLTPTIAIVLAPILAIALLLTRLLLRLTSPLRQVPGPRLNLLTSIPLKWNELRGRRTMYLHGLHLQYGPVVRVAPNEVSFTSEAAIKEIYCSGGSGFDKTDFYDLFRVYGRRTMFTMLRKEEHSKRRRVIADRYANSNVMKAIPLAGIEERARRFVEKCEKSIGSHLDIFVSYPSILLVSFSGLGPGLFGPDLNTIVAVQQANYLHSYACDCVTHHLFHPYGTDCLRDGADEAMMHQVASDDSLQNRLIEHYSPLLHKAISKFLYFWAKPRETPLADAFVLASSAQTDPESFTLLSRLREKVADDLDDRDMAAECLDHMAAGIDTTGDALCFIMWELSQPRSLGFQRTLQKELRANPTTPIEKLPFLDAVISEGLRCFPAIPMTLPRLVPQGGRVVDGVFLPENTIVGCQAYSVHRINDDVFPQPDFFDPGRWLDGGGETDRKRLQFAFANGGRGCVGKHLALAEMRTLLKAVYSRYTTTPDPSMTEEDMVMSDQLISSRPLGQRCLLRFTLLGEEAP